MSNGFIVTGTDTGIGKTVFAAALSRAIDGCYWKPIQAGLEDGTDAETVRKLSGLSPERVLPEAYKLTVPASPHFAAECDSLTIDHTNLKVPETERPLVVEGAGGLLVPIDRETLQIDMFASWRLPVILCARTALGTVNHSLMSLEALRGRNMPVFGIAFIGDENADSERTICEMGNVKRLGRLGLCDPLDAGTLAAAFDAGFDSADFINAGATTP